ncbi:MAG: transcription antitermination factor NusB [Acidobacteria bacterium]|nr:transcription antitermination factor NusB [Acidobacteriota bacterium]MBI3654865.1 transcription antitermination factor NusB [Acidobacteriota bacterium]
MGVRRKARECAVQMLFQYDMSGGAVADVPAKFWAMNSQAAEVMEFANQLFSGTVARLAEIDNSIRAHATNWRMDRMAAVDRNVLRLAVYELVADVTPKAVVINEALEIAKKFSTDESAHFVNGILDSIKNFLNKKAVNC